MITSRKHRAAHKKECKCMFCKTKRGEYTGKNSPSFKHGLTKLQRYEKLAGRVRPEQCEVCGAFRTKKKAICFDHDHITGNFRGWICDRCNSVLGYVNDSPELLKKLAEYLIDD